MSKKGSYGTYTRLNLGVGRKTIKLFDTDPDDSQQYLEGSTIREIAIYKYISHPNIAKLYKINYGHSNIDLYLENLEDDLESWTSKNTFYTRVRTFNKFIVDIMRALAYLHARGVVHGDLKPQNIAVAGTGEFKLIDFGGTSIRHKGVYEQPLTTYNFVGPEHATATYGPANDIWAVGVVAIFYFTKRLPVQFTSVQDAVEWFKTHDSLPVSKNRLPKPIMSLINQMLTFNAAERSTAVDILKQIDPSYSPNDNTVDFVMNLKLPSLKTGNTLNKTCADAVINSLTTPNCIDYVVDITYDVYKDCQPWQINNVKRTIRNLINKI